MFNSATGHTLPDTDTWLSVYEQDPETKLLLSMVKDPSLIITNNMNKLHFVYRRYIRESCIALSPTGMLVIYESIQGSLQNYILCHHLCATLSSSPLMPIR